MAPVRSTTILMALLVGSPTACFAQTWQPLTPPPRSGHGAAFDSLRGRMVVCGGHSDFEHLEDTWIADAGGWRTQTNATHPGRRVGHAIAYDSIRDRVVVFGGERNLVTLLNDTWEFDGTNWSQVTTVASPAPRAGATATFDLVRNRIVLFGGGVGPGRSDETWEYDGTNWAQVLAAVQPPARTGHAFCFDLTRQRCVLFGGWDIPTPTSPVIVHQDTWEYDGVNWNQVSPSLSPSARSGHAMAFDPVAGGVVLFGGDDQTSRLQDSWRFDGTNWTPIPGPAPGRRGGASLITDFARSRLVLFGGHSGQLALDDLWEFDGSAWTRRTASPGARAGAALCHEAHTSRSILFGGLKLLIANQAGYLAVADTWQHDGVAWQAAPTATSPPARADHAMAYDSARRRIVLFGGSPFFQALADTWEFDGTNWNQRATAITPPGRFSHALSYDSVRQRLVMFGGIGASFQRLADTWEFDGTNWSQRLTATAPPAREGPRLVFDTGRARTILFGGSTFTTSTVCFADTWELDGTGWSQVNTPGTPVGRQAHGMAYDLRRGRTLVFGGSNAAGTLLQDSWEYDGATWTPVVVGTAPPARFRTAVAYDASGGRVLMFGGNLPFGALGDTWKFEPPQVASWAAHGTGCAGSAGVPRLGAGPGAMPSLGGAFPLQLTQLPPQPGAAFLVFGMDFVQWNGAPLPAALGGFGLAGCQLWLAPAATVLSLHGGNAVTWPIQIPADPAFAGLTLGAQALSLDAGAPSGAGAVSNAVVLRVF